MFRHRVARASRVVEFRVLGAVTLLSADERELRPVLAQPKRVALLAYVAVASPRGFHRRDSLLALFWPDSTRSMRVPRSPGTARSASLTR